MGNGACEVYRVIKSDRGDIEVKRRCDAASIRSYKLAQGFGYFINPVMGVEPLAKAAERGDYVAIATHEDEIVGFLVAYQWTLEGLPSKIAFEDVYDIATEVSRKWRRHGIGSTLLEATVTDPFFDDKVLLIRGNPDYWDCYGDECRVYAMFIMEVPVMKYGFEKLPVSLPGDLFTLVKIGPKSRVTKDELTSLILRLTRSIESEFYPF
ncbi:MAG: GNAT family N-acetyltransferase [Desulfurococcales archaeon]|nr:GNAT family N-acetyltransferase [Desulfurococcales archaeon]